MTNGNVHPLKNRMKVNIFSFYAASAQLILIQLAMSTRTKFEIRHRIYLQSNSSLYLTRCVHSVASAGLLCARKRYFGGNVKPKNL